MSKIQNLKAMHYLDKAPPVISDLSFEPKVQRSICMDALYQLWCIEKVGKFQNIIDEFGDSGIKFEIAKRYSVSWRFLFNNNTKG